VALAFSRRPAMAIGPDKLQNANENDIKEADRLEDLFDTHMKNTVELVNGVAKFTLADNIKSKRPRVVIAELERRYKAVGWKSALIKLDSDQREGDRITVHLSTNTHAEPYPLR
jgi:hypothetical protein